MTCIHELIEAQAARTPAAIAVACGDTQVTYQELNARANRLARRLRRMGVGPDAPVGLCMERSIDLVVGILGILKAGGAYLPLDPEYPTAHLMLVMEDAAVTVVVTQQGARHRFTSTTQRPVSVVAMSIDAAAGEEDETNLPDAPGEESLAYVMYTSGSTGTPKGVMVTHRNLVHSTRARLTAYREPIESFLLLPPFTFDASVAVIFWTLCTGGRLVLPPTGAEREPSQIGRLILSHGISHLLCVSSLYAYILELATREELASIRVAIVGGDVCTPAMVTRHLENAPAAALFNEYGPAECTVWSSVCEASQHADDAVVPIGRPIAGTQMYVLDDELQPVPAGNTGELYIGGDGVARGYLNRPDLTAAHFIHDPFSREPGARLYKTGDLARYRSDGNVDFLGRLDHQVKVRGVRIEPEEIEAVLAQHPSVREAAVAAHEDARGAKRLVAHIVTHEGEALTVTDLRRFLKHRLPEFMVPSAFAFHDALPRTAGGKVDRRALPLPAHEPSPTHQGAEPPLALEFQLLEIWEDVLGMRAIGLDDNFFEIGGHSLLAAELLARMDALTGKQLPLTSLIEAPTIRQLARAFLEAPPPPASSPLVPVQPLGSKPAFFCVPGADQSALHYAPLARHLGRDQPLYALVEGVGQEDRAPDTRIEDVAARYIGEVRNVQPEGPYFLGGNSFGGLIAFEMARQLQRQGQIVSLLVLFDTAHPGPRIERYRRFAVRMFKRAWLHLRQLTSERQKLRYVRHKLRSLTRLVEVWALPRRSQQGERPRARALREVGAGDVDQFAYLRYVPQFYSGHLTLFRALDAAHRASRPLLGWGKLVESVEVHKVTGAHMTILREPHVRVLAERLRTCLASSQQSSEARRLDLQQLPQSASRREHTSTGVARPA